MTFELIGGNELAIHFDRIAENIPLAAAAAMGETVTFLRDIVVEQKLSGGALNARSGDLQRSIISTVEGSSGETVGIVMVDPSSPAARYGAVHEFGGLFEIPEHLSTSRLGNEFTVRGHTAEFPERSFLRSALDENAGPLAEAFIARFEQELVRA